MITTRMGAGPAARWRMGADMALSGSGTPTRPRNRDAVAGEHGDGDVILPQSRLVALAAIAIAAVVLGRAGATDSADPGGLVGGGLAVDLLMMLAGFAITAALLDEIERTGRVALASFYRCALRLLAPALVTVVIVVCAVALVAASETTTGVLKGEAAAALVGLSNWHSATVSMPVGVDSGSLLQHLWAPSLLVQVILVWPVIVVGCARLGGWARVRRVTRTLAVLSAALMVVLSWVWSVPGTPETARVAFGTDTRLIAVMAGAAIATMGIRQASSVAAPLTSGQLPEQARRAWDVITATALTGLVAAWALLPEYSTVAFRGGIAIVVLLGTAVLTAFTVTSSRIGVVASGIPFLAWLGHRAYPLYLWHWPLLAAYDDLPFSGIPAVVAVVLVAVVLADLTHRFIERPLRNGVVGRLADRLRFEEGSAALMMRRRLAVAASVGAGAVALVVAGMVNTPSAALPGVDDEAESTAEVEPEPEPVDCAVETCVALTFDDGPGPHTDELVAALDDRDVTATFFMLGEQVDRFPDVAARVAGAGHEIGSHTYSHPDLVNLDPDEAAAEVQEGAAAIDAATGAARESDVSLFRPPYGHSDDDLHQVLTDQGLSEIRWDVDTLDWKHRDPAAVVERAMEGVTDGSIVLLHDTRPTTVEAVPELIDQLRDQGFTVVPVGTLLDGLLEPGAAFASRPAPSPSPTSPTSSPTEPPAASSSEGDS